MPHLDANDRLGKYTQFLNPCHYHPFSTGQVELFPGSLRQCRLLLLPTDATQRQPPRKPGLMGTCLILFNLSIVKGVVCFFNPKRMVAFETGLQSCMSLLPLGK